MTDKDENRKIIAAEALKKLDEVKTFVEVNGSDHLNIIFDKLTENVEQLKLLKYILFILFTRIVWKKSSKLLIPVIFFFPRKNPKLYYIADTWL